MDAWISNLNPWVDSAWADVFPRFHVKITFFTYFHHFWWNDWFHHNQPHNFLKQNFISSLFMVSFSWYGFVLGKVAEFFVRITANFHKAAAYDIISRSQNTLKSSPDQIITLVPPRRSKPCLLSWAMYFVQLTSW